MKNSHLKCIVIIILLLMIGIDAIPGMRENIGRTSISSKTTFEYLIITNSYLENSNFQLLINYKSQYLTARIATKEDIVNDPDYWVNGIYGDGHCGGVRVICAIVELISEGVFAIEISFRCISYCAIVVEDRFPMGTVCERGGADRVSVTVVVIG